MLFVFRQASRLPFFYVIEEIRPFVEEIRPFVEKYLTARKLSVYLPRLPRERGSASGGLHPQWLGGPDLGVYRLTAGAGCSRFDFSRAPNVSTPSTPPPSTHPLRHPAPTHPPLHL